MNFGTYNMYVKNKTIIITDPCYIIKKCSEENPYPFPWTVDHINSPNFEELQKNYTNWENEHDDWRKCDYGDNMEALGITNYICRDTLYGDWSCTTYNTDTKERIGRFCADAGLVAVFELDEVLKYNPEFNYHKERPWTTTLIENFIGNINFEVVHQTGVYTKEDEYESNGRIFCKEGEIWEEDEVRVIGVGNVNFFTTQTGL